MLKSVEHRDSEDTELVRIKRFLQLFNVSCTIHERMNPVHEFQSKLYIMLPNNPIFMCFKNLLSKNLERNITAELVH